MPAILSPVFDEAALGPGVTTTQRSLDRFARAHDASHYLLVPDLVVQPTDLDDVARIFRASHQSGRTVTFRSGGTSLSGQGVSDSVLVDTRTGFQKIKVHDAGRRVTAQPGATVRQVNAHLARYGRKLGPDPASEIACTIGGVVANNSSGMACGTEWNTYKTLDSMVFVLPSGTIIDTSHPDADERLRTLEPGLHDQLERLRARVVANEASVREIRRQYSMKNTMGYGLNSFLDYERPVDILSHLIIGSEGTLAFVAEATFRTIEVKPEAATALLVFPDLREATAALPELVATGLATIELMDARSLQVAQHEKDPPRELAHLDVTTQAAYLVEFQESRPDDIVARLERAAPLLASLDLTSGVEFTREAAARASLWHTRKGLYAAVAGARPCGTTALLEDIAVPIGDLLATCDALTAMFDTHGYEDCVIFGHARDGNIHFMLNERFEDRVHLARYERFTDDLVDLVLGVGGTLKAEHGTGRIMAPFVQRQFGDELYGVMRRVKLACDPHDLLNPGVLLSDNPRLHLENLKTVSVVEPEVDRCVECGYCEPVCPSRNLTMTPRQRIVVRRELQAAKARGETALVAEFENQYEYDGIETCAVDGMCEVACPVDINTGDLVRRLRAEHARGMATTTWNLAAKHWGSATRGVGVALGVAKVTPTPLVSAVTRMGRALLGSETVPLYTGDLPGGGRRRHPSRHEADAPEAVYFPSCIGSMFGAAGAGGGVTAAFLELCRRAGVAVEIPQEIEGLCCGTPWKSKGYLDGYHHMAGLTLPALLSSSREGALPVVCDAASCTEGLALMQANAQEVGVEFSALRFIDAVAFIAERVLPKLTLTREISSIALHHTCSSTELGLNPDITRIAQFVSPNVHIPIDWGCCAFAGDRGLLHPELTTSATDSEAREVREHEYEEYVSVNRTCELGMTRATGHSYRHLLEVLEEATRPLEPTRTVGR